MTDRDRTTRTRARAPGVGGVLHRMAVHYRVLDPAQYGIIDAATRCTKGGCKLDGGRRMPGAGLSHRSPRKAPLGKPAFQPYWGKLAVRNDRGDRGNVGIIRSPNRASILPDRKYNANSARPRIFDGAAEAKLIALTCGPAPAGYARWSLRLLEEKVVELQIVERASDNTIGRTLKK